MDYISWQNSDSIEIAYKVYVSKNNSLEWLETLLALQIRGYLHLVHYKKSGYSLDTEKLLNMYANSIRKLERCILTRRNHIRNTYLRFYRKKRLRLLRYRR